MSESPRYEVLRHSGRFELRRYLGHLTAHVRVKATDPAQATNVGFSPLADYIFGNNHASDRISMTVPVTAGLVCCQRIAMTAPVSAVRDEQEYVVSFSMPTGYSLDSLPRPNNPAVELEAVEPYLAAAVRFSGHVHGDDADKATADLERWVTEQGFESAGEPILAQYDVPWKPGFARHNEVLLPVAEDSVK